MLKNAHIWSTGAALIRALAALASVQPTPRTMRILFRVTLCRWVLTRSRAIRWWAVDLDSHALFRMEGNGRNRSQCRNQSSPSWVRAVEQLSKRLRRWEKQNARERSPFKLAGIALVQEW